MVSYETKKHLMAKDTIIHTKEQPTDWGNISATTFLIEGLYLKYIKNSKALHIETTNNAVKNYSIDQNRLF